MGVRGTLPRRIDPVLATAGPLPTSPGWAYEAKFDGMRALVYASDDQWRLHTRTGRDATAGFPELAVLPDLVRGRAVVLDGELVSIGPTGVPEFSHMQQRMMSRRPSAALLVQGGLFNPRRDLVQGGPARSA